ncbi:MAG: hypothetical protein H6925_05000 [Holosporaceae bacterium]|nr:MAG: hypothetical protein H6925_05000 [Holosporaceae bacterium]
MNGYQIASIINAIMRIFPEERSDVVKHAHPFIRDNMSEYQIASIINAICEIPRARRNDALKQALDFIRDTMSVYYEASIIDTVRQMPPARHHANPPKENGHEIAIIIDAVRKIPREKRADVLKDASPLITNKMSAYYKAIIIDAVRKIPRARRSKVVDLARNFIPRYMSSGHNIRCVLQELSKHSSNYLAEHFPRICQTLKRDIESGRLKPNRVLQRILQLIKNPYATLDIRNLNSVISQENPPAKLYTVLPLCCRSPSHANRPKMAVVSNTK